MDPLVFNMTIAENDIQSFVVQVSGVGLTDSPVGS